MFKRYPLWEAEFLKKRVLREQEKLFGLEERLKKIEFENGSYRLLRRY